MHPELYNFYEKELQFIRGMGKEFAERHPGVAQRLDLGGFDCADPYVERLLEGFAFLTARIQLKLHAEYPEFTQHLLDMVYPHYLAPTPSMAMMHFEPDLNGGVTEEGFTIPRDTRLRSPQVGKSHIRCEYRTSQEVRLWPVEITDVEYMRAGEANHVAPHGRNIKSGIRLVLKTVSGMPFNAMTLSSLSMYLGGSGETPSRIYEMLLAYCTSVILRPANDTNKFEWQVELPAESVVASGFADDEALLPVTDASFSGYRYLQEYFAFPQRFLFVKLNAMDEAVQRHSGEQLEIIFLFSEANDLIEDAISTENFVLNCSPAINLFPKRGDRIHLSSRDTRHHVVLDRTKPLDYEVYAIHNVTGFDASHQQTKEFRPFYASQDGDVSSGHQAFYTLHRQPRKAALDDEDSSEYVGTEVWLSLVDASEAPWSGDLKQLGIEALCTNRGLPLRTKRGTLFSLDDSVPVNAVRTLAKPTVPSPANVEGENAWRLINHLSLNYLSLMDSDDAEGAAALRELLELYGGSPTGRNSKQIDGVVSIKSSRIVERLPGAGPITFGRGVGIDLNLEESAFKGTGAFLLAMVLEKFFAKYVSLNSFTRTRLSTVERGLIKEWPIRIGQRVLI